MVQNLHQRLYRAVCALNERFVPHCTVLNSGYHRHLKRSCVVSLYKGTWTVEMLSSPVRLHDFWTWTWTCIHRCFRALQDVLALMIGRWFLWAPPYWALVTSDAYFESTSQVEYPNYSPQSRDPLDLLWIGRRRWCGFAQRQAAFELFQPNSSCSAAALVVCCTCKKVVSASSVHVSVASKTQAYYANNGKQYKMKIELHFLCSDNSRLSLAVSDNSPLSNGLLRW